MQETDRPFAGSIPQIYDRYLAPLIFAPYARDLADRVASHPAASVLETAAGTGVATRALVRALPADTRITATDLNRPMLDFAAARPGAANVVWRQADAMMLPFEGGTFDAVVCQFGAMFFLDKVAAYREARRVLQPGGRFFLNVWDRIEDNELGTLVTEAVASLFPADPRAFWRARRTATSIPAGSATNCGRPDLPRSRSRRWNCPAGRRHRGIRPSGFCQGTPLRAEIEARDPARLGEATAAVAHAVAARFGDGPLACRMQAHVIVAVRLHEPRAAFVRHRLPRDGEPL